MSDMIGAGDEAFGASPTANITNLGDEAFGASPTTKITNLGNKAPRASTTNARFLKTIRGRPVVVKLNSGVQYRGIVVGLDAYMNIAMEHTEEYVNGHLKNKYDDVFIRGNNVLYISRTNRTSADEA